MRTAFLAACQGRQRFAFALRLHFGAARPRFQFQEFQLRVAELLAGRTVLLEPLLKLLIQLGSLLGFGRGGN